MAKKSPNPVSRIDSGRTHGWLARVYRAEWSRGKSFADRQYGGRSEAESAAYRWVQYADARLPVIPSKPDLHKATVTQRKDPVKHLEYFDVYTTKHTDNLTSWSQKFYFRTPQDAKIFRSPRGIEKIDLVTDDKEAARQKANKLADEINARLQAEYREALVAWY